MSITTGSASMPTPPATSEAGKIRVMVVDDAVVVRGLVGRWVNDEADMTTVGTFRGVKEALEGFKIAAPDVIVLDIEMPDITGLEAIPLFLKLAPKVSILMVSTLTQRNAEISLKALHLGAQDYVPKPESNSGVTTSTEFKRELMDKVRGLGQKHKPAVAKKAPTATQQPTAATKSAPQDVNQYSGGAIAMRPVSRTKPQILVIGCSTGGPQALQALMPQLVDVAKKIPILITQHMPATFTAILAEHIGKATNIPCREATYNDALKPNQILVAPGGLHMILAKQGDHIVATLEDSAPVNFCKPAVDPMFKSAASLYGASVLSIVLTGMGSDGALGGVAIANAGGTVVVQDEASSVVWGMPGATYNAKCCAAVLPLPEIGKFITKIVCGGV